MSCAFILGITWASFAEIKIQVRLFFLLAAIILIFVFFKQKMLLLAGFILVFFVIGLYRYDFAEINNSSKHIKNYNEQAGVEFEAMVVSEPDIRKDQIKYTLEVETINFVGGNNEAEGKVLATLPRYPEYSYGDRLLIRGKLLTPKEFDDFSYKDYLAKFQIYSVTYDPKIKLISSKGGNYFYQKILELKKSYQEKLNRSLPEPQASLLSGIILGAKRALPEDIREKFNLTGVSHIIVISGFHVAIVAGLLMNFAWG